MPINNLEIEIRKRDDGYYFSSEDDDKKRVYAIFSPELRQKVREIIFPFGTSDKGNVQYQGKNGQGDSIFYQQTTNSDQLTLISGELAEQQKLQEMDDFAEFEKELAELELRKKEWQKENDPKDNAERHYWCGKDNNGNIIYEGSMYVSKNKSQLALLENTTASLQIQGITGEAAKEIERENDNSKGNFTQQQQVLPKR